MFLQLPVFGHQRTLWARHDNIPARQAATQHPAQSLREEGGRRRSGGGGRGGRGALWRGGCGVGGALLRAPRRRSVRVVSGALQVGGLRVASPTQTSEPLVAPPPRRRHKPVAVMAYGELLAAVRPEIAESPFVGKGHRSCAPGWRCASFQTSAKRVRRLTRDAARATPARS